MKLVLVRHLAHTKKEKQIVKAIQSLRFPYQPFPNVKKKMIFDFDLVLSYDIILR